MFSWRLRPCFRQNLDLPCDEAKDRIVNAVLHQHPSYEIKSFTRFICLRIPPGERHFWSPRLNLSLEENEAGGTCVQGTFGPNANLWSLYLYGYLIIGLIAMFSGMFGACQLFVGMSAWGLWVFAGSVSAALSMYLASRLGQRFATPQSDRLQQIYVEAIGQEIEIH